MCPGSSSRRRPLRTSTAWRDSSRQSGVACFAPETSPQALENSIRRPGLGRERTYLARRDEEIVGVLGAWDMGAFHAARVVSYSAAATFARGVHAAVRTVFREGAPLPGPGEAFRSLTITNLAVRGGDPRVLRALLSAVNNDHVGQGFHLMHLGAAGGEDWAPALSWLAAAALQLVALRALPDGWPRSTRRIALEPLRRPIDHLSLPSTPKRLPGPLPSQPRHPARMTRRSRNITAAASASFQAGSEAECATWPMCLTADS